MALPEYVIGPGHLVAADLGHVLVLVDYRDGAVQCLLPPAASWWRRLAETGSLDATEHPGLAGQLLAAGYLLPTSRPVPWAAPVTVPPVPPSWGSAEHPAGLALPARIPAHRTVAAAVALSTVLAVKTAGTARTAMRRILALVRVCAARARRAATLGQIDNAVRAVRRAAWAAPVRAACLEESAAVVMLLAARRLGVTWCHGIAADPVRLHAWVQTGDGHPVAEPTSTGAYTPLVMISGGDRP